MAKEIIACDLDGTLAHYDGWKGIHHIGKVIESVKVAIQNVQKQGGEVWLFTARVSDPADCVEANEYIEKWLIENGISVVGITSNKFKFFTEFWDDRALQVIKNAGAFVIEDDSHSWQKQVPPTDQFIGKCDESGPAFLPVPEEPRTPTSALDIQEGGQHYKKYEIQPIEFVVKNNIPVLEANALKYVVRHADKNGMQDLRKARHYLELMAEMYYGEKL